MYVLRELVDIGNEANGCTLHHCYTGGRLSTSERTSTSSPTPHHDYGATPTSLKATPSDDLAGSDVYGADTIKQKEVLSSPAPDLERWRVAAEEELQTFAAGRHRCRAARCGNWQQAGPYHQVFTSQVDIRHSHITRGACPSPSLGDLPRFGAA